MEKNKGFTLVELIVTVTVIMVLTGVGAMSLNSFNGTKDLESVTEEVSNHIKLAKNLAITKQLPDSATNLKFVSVNISDNKIKIIGVNSVGLSSPTSPYSTMTVKSGIGVSSSSNFNFAKSNGRLVDSDGNPSDIDVVVSVSGSGGTKIININNSGIISNGN
jgi:prepilin-type N-terminal cleavage/methylation domain-containing protein